MARVRRRYLLPLFSLLLAACAPAQVEMAGEGASTRAAQATPSQVADLATATLLPASIPTTTLQPTLPPTAEPTAAATETAALEPVTPLPSPTSEPVEPQVISGQTAEGVFFLGAAAAPLTLIDYSDFL